MKDRERAATDTPRTDAVASEGWSGDAACVSHAFAQGLERELAAAETKLAARVDLWPAERERLISWHTDCANGAMQQDYFNSESQHRLRAAELRGTRSGDHPHWLAEAWEMIEECARRAGRIGVRATVTLSPEGCAALLAERKAKAAGQ